MFAFLVGVFTVAFTAPPTPTPTAPTFSNVNSNIKRFVACAVLDSPPPGSFEVVPGQVQKRNEAVFSMDMPWETNVNNGYSSVLYDKDNTHGLGVYVNRGVGPLCVQLNPG